MYRLVIRSSFAAAHCLIHYQGDCENLHGHNWKVEVVARSASLDGLGMVMDFRRLKDLTDQVLGRLDHEYLNEVEPFTKLNPTAENIARYIYDEISRYAPLHRVNVFETESSVASYIEDP